MMGDLSFPNYPQPMNRGIRQLDDHRQQKPLVKIITRALRPQSRRSRVTAKHKKRKIM